MKFTPSAGMMPITPREYDNKWGDVEYSFKHE